MEQTPLYKLLPTLRSFSIKELQDGSYIHKEIQEYYFDKSTYKDLERNFQAQDTLSKSFVHENVVDAPWPKLKLKPSKTNITAIAVNEIDSDDPPWTEESTNLSKIVAKPQDTQNTLLNKASRVIVTSEAHSLDISKSQEDLKDNPHLESEELEHNQSVSTSAKSFLDGVIKEDFGTMAQQEQSSAKNAAVESAFVEDILPLSDLLVLIDDYVKVPGKNLKFKF